MNEGRLCSNFTRHGSAILGRSGALSARWDRRRGGTMTVAQRGSNGRCLEPAVEFSSAVRLVKNGHPWLAAQSNDPDPRLVFCEEGPERLVMRVMFALIDERGCYHGDGATDAVLWANGDVHLAFALRLVDLTAHDSVTDAFVEARLAGVPEEVEAGTRSRLRLAPAGMRRPRWLRLPGGVPRKYVLAAFRENHLCIGWFDHRGNCYEDLGGAGPWAGPGNEPPYYERWGHLYDQWKGEAGWENHPSASLGLVPSDGDFACRWHWLRDGEVPAEAEMTWRALLALRFGGGPSRAPRTSSASRSARSPLRQPEALRRMVAFQKPLLPRVQGGEFRCLDVLENALVVKRTAGVTKLTFSRDPLARTVHVRLFGLKGTGGVVVSAPGGPVLPHLLTCGGLTDDPYGPNHARPGDRHAPLLGDPSVPPDEVVFSVGLSRRGKTIVTVRETEGLNFAYLKWDDRRLFAVRSSRLNGTFALFSPRTLCLHDLRARPGAQPALVRLPLYWYLCNAPSPFHCLNLLEGLRLLEVGPEALRFEVTACNRGQRARSTMRVAIPAGEASPAVRVSARLDVLRQWDLPTIQYLNAFPEDSRQPRDWSRDWVLLVDSKGRVVEYFFKERLKGQRRGDPVTEWRDRLVLVQGACAGGNVFIYVANRWPDRQTHDYRLCRVWLDSHFSIVSRSAPLRAGRRFEVDYVVVVGGDAGLTRARALDIARRALEEGDLQPCWIAPGP